MNARANRFRTKVDAFRRAEKVYICLPCFRWLPAGIKTCDRCGSRGQHFASRGEALRYADLRARQAMGLIRDLILQPAFPVRINGLLLCTYRADFQYIDTADGRTVIEDYKGSAAYVDDASRLRRKAAELFYSITVEIVEG